MKKMTIILTAFVMLLSATVFAAEGDTVPAKVKAAFVKDFSNITDVKWEQSGDLYFAYFKLNGSDVKAIYKEEGELNSASRVLSFGQLPLAVTIAVKQKYEGYNVTDKVTEVTAEGATSYYINVDNEKQVLMLKANNNGDISVESKVKK